MNRPTPPVPGRPVPGRLMQLTRAVILVFVAAFALAQLLDLLA
ncbi:hypothetical protein [Brevundimonas sp.]|nr:hypothetical protein [Brevundimonas sp.]